MSCHSETGESPVRNLLSLAPHLSRLRVGRFWFPPGSIGFILLLLLFVAVLGAWNKAFIPRSKFPCASGPFPVLGCLHSSCLVTAPAPRQAENRPLTKPNNPGGKQNPKREHDVHVRGTILTDFAPGEEKRHAAERREDTAAHNAERAVDLGRESHKVWLERFTLLAVLIYAGITFWQGCLTQQITELAQRTFDASQRPYVGVASVTPAFNFPPEMQKHPLPLPVGEANGMKVTVEIKNFGPVPGTEYHASWRIFLDDSEVKPNEKIPDTPTTIYPTQSTFFIASVDPSTVHEIVLGRSALEIEVSVNYAGPTRSYGECVKHRYAPQVQQFWALGACTH